MTGQWFHKGLFCQQFKRLMPSGITLGVLLTLFDCFPILLGSLNGMTQSNRTASLVELHPWIATLPLLAALMLMYAAFHIQNSRVDADFYHSLPLTKRALALSSLTAVFAWCGIILVASTAIVWLFAAPCGVYIIGMNNLVLPLCKYAAKTVLFVAVAFVAYAVCGTTRSAIASTLILLYAPYFIIGAPYGYAADLTRVLPAGSIMYFDDLGLLFNFPETLTSPIRTILLNIGLAAALIALGSWFYHRRPSEIAGSPAIFPWVHVLFRILLFMVCCIPAIELICECVELGEELGYIEGGMINQYIFRSILTIYLIALVVYFMFELIITRKPKALLKAVPWLGVVAVLNVALVLITHATVHTMATYSPKPEHVRSVSILTIDEAEYLSPSLQLDSDERDALLSWPTYEARRKFTNAYSDNGCDDVRLRDEKSLRIICDTLESMASCTEKYGCEDVPSCHRATVLRHDPSLKKSYVYLVDVAIREFGVTHYRKMYLSEDDLTHLLCRIHEKEPLEHIGYGTLVNILD